MYLGRVVETGSSEAIFSAERHPYTASLLSAVPSADPSERRTRRRIVLQGDPPDPADPPAGCCFHTRCWKATDVCITQRPTLVTDDQAQQQVACHLPLTSERQGASAQPRAYNEKG
jgi:oligopeptide transport system ATP-binding protein